MRLIQNYITTLLYTRYVFREKEFTKTIFSTIFRSNISISYFCHKTYTVHQFSPKGIPEIKTLIIPPKAWSDTLLFNTTVTTFAIYNFLADRGECSLIKVCAVENHSHENVSLVFLPWELRQVRLPLRAVSGSTVYMFLHLIYRDNYPRENVCDNTFSNRITPSFHSWHTCETLKILYFNPLHNFEWVFHIFSSPAYTKNVPFLTITKRDTFTIKYLDREEVF